MNLRGILLLILATLLSFGSFSANAEVEGIQDAVGVNFSAKGLEYFQKNLMEVLEANGVETRQYYFEKIVHKFANSKTEDLSGNQKTKNGIKLFKDYFAKAFQGFVLNNHEVQLTLNGLFLETQWDDVQINFFDPNKLEAYSDRDYLAGVNLKVSASNIRFGVEESSSLVDLNNDWLGEVGTDRFVFNVANEGPAFTFMISLALYKDYDGKIAARVEQPESNFSQLSIGLDYEPGTLRFPDVSLKINEHEFKMNRESIENWFGEEEGVFLTRFQDAIQGYLDNNLDSMIGTLVSSKLGKGIEKYNEAVVPGAKPEMNAPPLIWGMFFDRLEYESDLLTILFSGDVFDFATEENGEIVKKQYPALPEPYTASEPLVLENHNLQDFDLTLHFNIELFNQFIKVGYDRGYLTKFAIDEEAFIDINSAPYLRMTEDGRVKMELDIYSKVGTTTEKMVIKDKIRLKVDIFVKLEVLEDGTVGLVFDEIDLDSREILNENIRLLGKLFKGKIRKGVDEKLVEANGTSEGTVLARNIPIPTKLWGLDLKVEDISVDKAGYFLVKTNFLNLKERD